MYTYRNIQYYIYTYVHIYIFRERERERERESHSVKKGKSAWARNGFCYVPNDCQHDLLEWLQYPKLCLYRKFTVFSLHGLLFRLRPCSGKPMFRLFINIFLTKTCFSVPVTYSSVNFICLAVFNHQILDERLLFKRLFWINWEFGELRSTPSLPLLPGPLWPGVVAPDRDPIYGLNRTNSIIMINWIVWLNWIVWNRNVFLTLKLYLH